MLRRLLRSRFVLPVALLGAVGLATLFGLAAGAGASGSSGYTSSTTSPTTSPTATTASPHAHKVSLTPGATNFVNTKPTVTPSATACTKSSEEIGYNGPAGDGSPTSSSSVRCSHGHVVQYGDPSITYKLPPASYIPAGHSLFEQNCSSCHMPTAQGSAIAPSLRGVGPATVNFWVTTGRMPAATPLQVQADAKPPRFTVKQANEIAAWINSLSPAAPYIPTVHLENANLSKGSTLFALNCAACHTITGAGDALAFGTFSSSLHKATARQVAEAIRTGPGNMPRFTGNLSDAQVRDIVAYVTEKIQHPTDAGGFGLGGIGPVAEGFVALLFGVGGLMLVAFWIGDRS